LSVSFNQERKEGRCKI